MNENRTEPGKWRPVMVIASQDEKCTVVPVTGTKSMFNQINGYQIKDWQEARLKKPSFVNCHPKDARNVSLQDMKYVGRLSLRDRVETFKKMDQVTQKVKAQQQAKRKRHRGPENDGPEL
ncbi:hypothetical protein MKX54_20200 [Alkalihalobacillus sp. FSL R5-0424]